MRYRLFAILAAPTACYDALMDPLKRDDIDRSMRMQPADRMRAVFATVNAGVRLRRAALRAKRPQATEAQIEAALKEWLLEDERANH